MAKVLLVEDDNNLREIYEARLQAEGYETVTASDGEQALVVAKDAKPDLVISDVMMPKISGFEMLDILRNTDGLKDVKVIMLTALGQSEDKARADQLGADKYLVKSQVTLEDIVKTAHQLLDDGAPATAEPAPAAAPTPTVPAAEPAAAAQADATSASDESAAMQAQIDNFVAEPAATQAAPAADPVAAAEPTAPASAADNTAAHDEVMAEAVDSLADASPEAQKPSDVTAVEVPPQPTAEAPAPAAEPETADPAEESDDDSDGVTIGHKKIIKPISDPVADKKPDLNSLLAAEEAKVAGNEVAPNAATVDTPDTTGSESAAMQAKLDSDTAAADAPSAPKSATAPATPVSVAEPPADPSQPNPNDVAL
jgi:DNA-binding response OmpR family regulator